MNPPTIPSIRAAYGMAYDTQSDHLILFGGWNGKSNLGDTWAYDYNTSIWTDRASLSSPSARSYNAMAYDSQSDRIILFGGASGGCLDDTWAYDYDTNTWTFMDPVIKPPARFRYAMAYDSQSDRIILFGGWSASGGLQDTWAYDYNTNTWTNMNPSPAPSARDSHAMAYDSQSDRVVLYGGNNLSGYLGDTWAYDYNMNTWTNMNPNPAPSARYSHAMEYDSQSDRLILFSGFYSGSFGGTWAYNYDTNNWTNMNPTMTPSARYDHAMAYDAQNDRLILFGGRRAAGCLDDTWAYDYNTNNWTNLDPFTTPSARYDHTMTYDAQSDRLILFGGWDGASSLGDSYAYDYNTNLWKNMSPSSAPSARCSHAMAYDSQSDRIILFGGGYRDDTWAYDYDTNTWTNMNPSIRPSGRYGHAMAYDSQSDRIILYGGADSSGYLGDTWAYDYNTNTWTNMNPTLGPYDRRHHAMGYDTQGHLLILFGGEFSAGYLNDTWAYNYSRNAWKNMAPLSSPSARDELAMAYDSRSEHLFIFGGFNGGYRDDTWAYNRSTNTWTNMNPSGTPAIRDEHAMEYDTQNHRLILFGGFNGISLRDTWAYEFGQPPLPDIYPPYVVKTIPLNNDMNVSTATKIDIQWNESMNMQSAESAFSSTPSITCTWAWSYVTQTCTPSTALQPNTKYTITISTGAKDLIGNAMKNPHTFSFTTSTGGPSPPMVSSTSPTNGATNVPINTNIVMTFSEPMDKPITEGAISSSPSIAGTFAWDASAKVLTWDPDADLIANTEYTVTVSNSAKSQTGANMANDYMFSFTTGSGTGPTSPSVKSTSPVDKATGIALNTRISITFDKAMDSQATEGAVSTNPPITWTPTWTSGDSVVTFTPSADLMASTTYTITISMEAKTADGANLASPYPFSFTTGTTSDTEPPIIKSTDPSDKATDVDTAIKITITFSEAMDTSATEGAVSISPSVPISNKTWDAGGTRLTFTASLAKKTKYTATISMEAKDLAGNPLQSGYTFSFTTMSGGGPGPGSGGIDTTMLLLLLLIPIIVVVLLVILLLMRKRRQQYQPPSR